jgi:DNA-directed RNA polymerase subunit alpha
MTNPIHTPSITSVVDLNDKSSTIVIEPLHTGYGWTLGNSLRRILLSSIEGAAITGFKIAGAAHEFTTVPGVAEDIVELTLNIKGVRFAVEAGEVHTLVLNKKGAGVVTAGDIAKSADLSVVNPDHVICTLSDANASINMEIRIEKGRGYRQVEEGRKAQELADFINVDALFSPVLRVRYKVESTRVGQNTDLDKLSITIDTDGSITAKDAFEQANAILAGHYQALAGQTTVQLRAAALPVSPAQKAAESAEDEENSEMMTSIEDLNLTARTTNALINNDIHTIKDLFSLSESELRELKGFGSKALDEVKDKMAELEL